MTSPVKDGDYLLASSNGEGGIMIHFIRPLGPEWTPEKVMEEIRNNRHLLDLVGGEIYKMAVGMTQIEIGKEP